LGDPGKTDDQPYRTLEGINSVQLICGGRLRKFAQKGVPTAAADAAYQSRRTARKLGYFQQI
jgi:hypothetical protein